MGWTVFMPKAVWKTGSGSERQPGCADLSAHQTNLNYCSIQVFENSGSNSIQDPLVESQVAINHSLQSELPVDLFSAFQPHALPQFRVLHKQLKPVSQA